MPFVTHPATPATALSAPKQTPHYRGGVFQRLFDLLVSLVNRLNEVDLEVKRAGKTMFTLPVIAFVLLLIFAFWITLPLMAVGLFFCRSKLVACRTPGGFCIAHIAALAMR